jgi:hypothetical protein
MSATPNQAPVETPGQTIGEIQTVHLYPSNPRYRKSGMSLPQPGDIAYCGWVKQSPPRPGEFPLGSENCLMCIRLQGLAA